MRARSSREGDGSSSGSLEDDGSSSGSLEDDSSGSLEDDDGSSSGSSKDKDDGLRARSSRGDDGSSSGSSKDKDDGLTRPSSTVPGKGVGRSRTISRKRRRSTSWEEGGSRRRWPRRRQHSSDKSVSNSSDEDRRRGRETSIKDEAKDGEIDREKRSKHGNEDEGQQRKESESEGKQVDRTRDDQNEEEGRERRWSNRGYDRRQPRGFMQGREPRLESGADAGDRLDGGGNLLHLTDDPLAMRARRDHPSSREDDGSSSGVGRSVPSSKDKDDGLTRPSSTVPGKGVGRSRTISRRKKAKRRRSSSPCGRRMRLGKRSRSWSPDEDEASAGWAPVPGKIHPAVPGLDEVEAMKVYGFRPTRDIHTPLDDDGYKSDVFFCDKAAYRVLNDALARGTQLGAWVRDGLRLGILFVHHNYDKVLGWRVITSFGRHQAALPSPGKKASREWLGLHGLQGDAECVESARLFADAAAGNMDVEFCSFNAVFVSGNTKIVELLRRDFAGVQRLLVERLVADKARDVVFRLWHVTRDSTGQTEEECLYDPLREYSYHETCWWCARGMLMAGPAGIVLAQITARNRFRAG